MIAHGVIGASRGEDRGPGDRAASASCLVSTSPRPGRSETPQQQNAVTWAKRNTTAQDRSDPVGERHGGVAGGLAGEISSCDMNHAGRQSELEDCATKLCKVRFTSLWRSFTSRRFKIQIHSADSVQVLLRPSAAAIRHRFASPAPGAAAVRRPPRSHLLDRWPACRGAARLDHVVREDALAQLVPAGANRRPRQVSIDELTRLRIRRLTIMMP